MRLESLIPVLDVKDVDASIQFYCDAIGFTLYDKVEWGGKTEWALLRTGKIQLMLCAIRDDLADEPTRSNGSMFFFYPDNIEAMYVSLGTNGYEPLPNMPSVSPGSA